MDENQKNDKPKQKNKKGLFYMFSKFIKERRITFDKRAKKIGEDLLKDETLTQEEIEQVTKSLSNIEERKQKYDKIVEKVEINQDDIVKQQEQYSFKQDIEEKRVLRNKLYNGEIQCEQLKRISEENSNNLLGCIFIAEVCKYFELEQLGIKCLKGYQKANINMQVNEQRAISKAMELLKQKKIMVCPKEKWDEVYKTLGKVSDIEKKNDVNREN